MPEVGSGPAAGAIPARIGRYEIVCKLGVGGMADVFLAHQPGPFLASKLVVIKQLRPSVVNDEQFVEQFADESRIAVRLHHPNVVHTYEVVAEDSEYYLTLEFLNGKTLYQTLQRVKRESMPFDLHIWILAQVLMGLQYAHELADFDGTPLDIVHRDVSPSNVFLTYSGDVKLLDFGIAKSAGAMTFTRDGIVKGKLGYASPEQCLTEPVDCRTDLYSVGVMLWEAIAGRKRSVGGTDASTLEARIRGTEQPIAKICPNAPAELAAICNRALARLPRERFSSAQEFRLALENYLRSNGFEGGQEKLKELMTKHYDAEQREIRRTIEEHLASTRSRSSRPPQSSELAPEIPGDGRLPQIEGGQSLMSGFLPPSELPDWEAPRKKFRIFVATVIVLAIAAATGGLLVTKSSESGPHPAATVSTTEPRKPANPPQQTDGRPSTESLWVTVSAVPDEAEIRLDGRRVSNPYRAAHGRDAVSHHITVSLQGYKTLEREVLFASDLVLRLSLDTALNSETRGPRNHSPGVRRAAVNPPPIAIPTPLVFTTPPAVEEPKPGDDLRGLDSRTTKTRGIDETDPYKR
jgi:eukaryotic-like serine/threonine-protein kinase